MTIILNATNLFLDDVHRLLHLEEKPNGSFATLLTLEHLTETEQKEFLQIVRILETISLLEKFMKDWLNLLQLLL